MCVEEFHALSHMLPAYSCRGFEILSLWFALISNKQLLIIYRYNREYTHCVKLLRSWNIGWPFKLKIHITEWARSELKIHKQFLSRLFNCTSFLFFRFDSTIINKRQPYNNIIQIICLRSLSKSNFGIICPLYDIFGLKKPLCKYEINISKQFEFSKMSKIKNEVLLLL